VILGFILFYKLEDTILHVMKIPFLLSQGYSRTEIAEIAKYLGKIAMILGGISEAFSHKRTSEQPSHRH
jgi:hypothetical protein